MNKDPRPTLEVPDDDPYLWLESVEGDECLHWVERQNKATLDRFGGPAQESDRDVLTRLFDHPANIPYIRRRGGQVYNLWKDTEHPRGILRRTTLADYQSTQPKWETVLDVDALAVAENEDWILSDTSTLPGTHDRAILRLSRGGSDAVVLREYDMNAKAFVRDGFFLPEAKGGIVWLDRETVLLSSAYGQDMATDSGYGRSVRLWRRGTRVDQASILFETDATCVGTWAHVDRTMGREDIWFAERLNFFDTRWKIGDRNGPHTVIDLPSDASLDCERGWLIVRLRAAWSVNEKTYAPDTVLGIRFSAFLEGNRDFEVLFETQERRALQWFLWCGPRLVLSILDNLVPVFEFWTVSDDGWVRSEQSGLPQIAAATAWRLDHEADESNGDLITTIETPITPPTLTLLASGEAPAILKQAPATFDASTLMVSRHEVESVDGERIPYVQVGPKTITGEAPVHLSGYGGFRLSRLPHYNTAIGKLWLERGGTNVIANIRGGGEFGTRWHEAGRREGKRLSHDDFAAVAADLVNRGITRPERIAAEGGSNGGILITNMLTRYPQRFGALFCTIPLIDMRRYTKLLAGASWIAEYGDPNIPQDWEFLQHYSAYHLAKPGQAYPPILLATTRRDDRVHPGHARKMAAKLQAMGYRAFFYESAAGGHGAGKDNHERANFIALGYRFLGQSIGWLD